MKIIGFAKRTSVVFLSVLSLCIPFGCNRVNEQSESGGNICHIYGSIDGLPQKGLYRMLAFDSWNRSKVIAKCPIKEGRFSMYVDATQLTHVYLYCANRFNKGEMYQIRDFILEPGEIEINGKMDDEESIFSLASGTPTNNMLRELRSRCRGQENSVRDSIVSEFMNSNPPEEAVLFIIEREYFNPHAASQVFNTLSERLQNAQYFTGSVREYLQINSNAEDLFKEGELYRELAGVDPDGNECRLSEFIGRREYTLVDYWGTWCKPCVKALPDIARLMEKDFSGKMTVVGVNYQEGKRGDDMRKFLSENGVKWDIIIDNSNSIDYLQHVPHVALYDRDGRLLMSGHPSEILPKAEELL